MCIRDRVTAAVAATTMIRDGDWVEVDGTAGTATLFREAADDDDVATEASA